MQGGTRDLWSPPSPGHQPRTNCRINCSDVQNVVQHLVLRQKVCGKRPGQAWDGKPPYCKDCVLRVESEPAPETAASETPLPESEPVTQERKAAGRSTRPKKTRTVASVRKKPGPSTHTVVTQEVVAGSQQVSCLYKTTGHVSCTVRKYGKERWHSLQWGYTTLASLMEDSIAANMAQGNNNDGTMYIVESIIAIKRDPTLRSRCLYLALHL